MFFFFFFENEIEKYGRVARLDYTVDYKLLRRNVSIVLSRNEKGETQLFRYMGTYISEGRNLKTSRLDR